MPESRPVYSFLLYFYHMHGPRYSIAIMNITRTLFFFPFFIFSFTLSRPNHFRVEAEGEICFLLC